MKGVLLQRQPRVGRPKTTDKRLNLRIMNISEADPHMSAPKIHAKLAQEGKEVYHQCKLSEEYYINASGKHESVARKLPFMSKSNIKKRMQFYTDYILKPLEFWNRVLWTDESLIRLKYSHGRMFVWRKKVRPCRINALNQQ